nr:MAG TPA: hypothetical protein [Caudoviricetes sp.]
MRPKSRQCVTVPHGQDGGGIRKNEVRRFCGRFGSMAEARRAVGASEAQSSIQEEPIRHSSGLRWGLALEYSIIITLQNSQVKRKREFWRVLEMCTKKEVRFCFSKTI